MSQTRHISVGSDVADDFLPKQLLEAEQQAAVLRNQVRELELCLDSTRSQLREKDAHLEEQKRKERDLLTTVTE